MIHQRIRFEACLFRELIKLFVYIFLMDLASHTLLEKEKSTLLFFRFSIMYVEEQTFCRVNAGRSMTYVYGLQLYASCL